MMSVNAPPLIEISKTAPSNVLSVLKLFLKVTLADAEVILMVGVSSVPSVTQLGSLWKAEFGAVSAPLACVTQFEPRAQVPEGVQFAAPLVNVDTQPAGKAGAVTPSKFSWRAVASVPNVNVYVTVPKFVAPSWS